MEQSPTVLIINIKLFLSFLIFIMFLFIFFLWNFFLYFSELNCRIEFLFFCTNFVIKFRIVLLTFIFVSKSNINGKISFVAPNSCLSRPNQISQHHHFIGYYFTCNRMSIFVILPIKILNPDSFIFSIILCNAFESWFVRV